MNETHDEVDNSRDPETVEEPRKSKAKRNARVRCAGGSEFWTTQRQFWAWVRENVVTYESDTPLTGKFEGRRERLLVMVNHILLDDSSPEHKASVLRAYDYKKRTRSRPNAPKTR